MIMGAYDAQMRSERQRLANEAAAAGGKRPLLAPGRAPAACSAPPPSRSAAGPIVSHGPD
jgi:hypothetical protein